MATDFHFIISSETMADNRAMSDPLTDPLYADPEAYDLAYGWDSLAETRDVVAAAAVLRGQPVKRALEIGCGTGRVLADLAALGLAAVGLDRHPGMLAFAERKLRAKGLTAETVNADMRDFRLAAPVDLAICPLGGIGYLTAPGDPERHLAAVAANLTPGGVYAVGLSFGPIERSALGRKDGWSFTRDNLSVEASWTLLAVDADRGLAEFEAALTIRRPGEPERRIVARHVHRKWDQPQFYRLIAASPFRLAGLAWRDLTPIDPALRLSYADEEVYAFLRKT